LELHGILYFWQKISTFLPIGKAYSLSNDRTTPTGSVECLRFIGQTVDAYLWRLLQNAAKKLGIKVVVEGIESSDQVCTLLTTGCPLGQGYHFSKAVPRDTITQMLLHRAQQAKIAICRSDSLSGIQKSLSLIV